MLGEDQGLDGHGHVRREGDLSLVQRPFAPLVQQFVSAARATFAADLDSVYLYGSIPRGTARVGVSDLDGQLLLRREPTADDRVAVRHLEETLGAAAPQVSSVGILLDSRAALVDPAERYDGGFHIRVLCTPVWGPDAGAEVSPHTVSLELARGIQGDWRGALRRLRQHGTHPPADLGPFCRSTGRRLARIAFAWVMPRWGGWSSDPAVMHRVVAGLEPGWAAPMAAAVRLGWEGEQSLALAQELLDDFAEELTVHGTALGA
ncbi:nucleotidyltransferase domain-containing protein [Ornithinimicrobium sufpigmenti]|uniref:nucleotidyltransferase domain-containing protein n=1 Tax=Ornithinimicrobium sufpigmenti TaxID=2508882 RepID=UPI0010356EE1|nr:MULTISPECIES: nucleotidyltransferase domain-containing protein [unclassified Ornithinimicrobium]